ncbi:MAG: 30S ribosome-binding factor RbfA [Pseudomonadales bacterium]
MPREFKRAERVADFVKRELAILLQRELRDPRASGAVINDVVVSRDISYAKVYVTFLDAADASEARQAVETLNGAAGFLRTQLAHVSEMRTTPRLQFYYDQSVRDGEYLSKLIDAAVIADRSAVAGSQGERSADARPAGETAEDVTGDNTGISAEDRAPG